MNRKTMQIVIVVVCLIGAGVFLAYALGFFGGSAPQETGTDSGLIIAPVEE